MELNQIVKDAVYLGVNHLERKGEEVYGCIDLEKIIASIRSDLARLVKREEPGFTAKQAECLSQAWKAIHEAYNALEDIRPGGGFKELVRGQESKRWCKPECPHPVLWNQIAECWSGVAPDANFCCYCGNRRPS